MATVDGNTLTLEPGEVADLLGYERHNAQVPTGTTSSTTSGIQPQPDQVQTRPSLEESIAAVQAEASARRALIGPIQAQEFDRWIGRVVDYARENGGEQVTYHMSTREWKRFHKVLLLVMRDDSHSTPGSAHDLLERRHLRFNDGEIKITIMHTNYHGACVMVVTIEFVDTIVACATID